jgi:hypothetical protein
VRILVFAKRQVNEGRIPGKLLAGGVDGVHKSVQYLLVLVCSHVFLPSNPLETVREFGAVENSYIESFNRRLRDECLNAEVFLDLADARRKLDKWRSDYNQERPHSALADRTPEEFASVAMQLSFALSAAERAKDLTQEAVCVERFK